MAHQQLGQRGAIALAQVLVAGAVVVGGVGVGVALQQSGVVGDGDDTVEVALSAVPTFDCPDGSDVGELHRGDRVLATGRDDEGVWAEVRDPRDLGDRVWVSTRYLVPDADLSDLDVHECAVDEDDAAVAATAPGSPASLPPGVTTTTTKRVATPAPAAAPPPDTAGPAISGVGANPTEIWETFPSTCTGKPKQSTITASASDPSGVASVTASWAFGAVNESKAVPATFGPFPDNTIANNTQVSVTVTITARDSRGNASTAATTVVVHSVEQCFG